MPRCRTCASRSIIPAASKRPVAERRQRWRLGWRTRCGRLESCLSAPLRDINTKAAGWSWRPLNELGGPVRSRYAHGKPLGSIRQPGGVAVDDPVFWAWRFVATVVAIVLCFIGLSGVPGDIEAWRRWIGIVLAELDQNNARWVCLAIGLALIAVVWLPWQSWAGVAPATRVKLTGPMATWPEAHLLNDFNQAMKGIHDLADKQTRAGEKPSTVWGEMEKRMLAQVDVVVPAAIESNISARERDRYLAIIARAREQSSNDRESIVRVAYEYLGALLVKRSDEFAEKYQKLQLEDSD